MGLIHITIEKVIVDNNDDDIIKLLHSIILNLNNMATTLDQVLQSVTENASVGESVVTLLTGLKTRLDEVLSGTVIPPQVQTKIDAIFNASEADTKKLADAIVANTPSE